MYGEKGFEEGEIKKQRLMDLITQKISEEMKKFLETLFLIERELFCTKRNNVGNSYYKRSLKIPFLEIENLRVPRTREKNFKPALLQNLKRAFFF